MNNIGKTIKDFYCNGFAGRRYDLAGSVIENEGKDWIVIRTEENEPIFINFGIWLKQEHIDNWVNREY
jgi:hypothetical protein